MGLSAAASQTLGPDSAILCSSSSRGGAVGVVKVGQRKTCEIRSCDNGEKKNPLSMKRTLFSNTFHKVSSSFSPSAYKMRLSPPAAPPHPWPKSGAHSPHAACTTFSPRITAREEGNPSLGETPTHWIVLHYLRDSQEIFNKYITHCIKINIIYKTFIVFCLSSSSSYSVYKCAQYRWDLQRFAWILSLNAFSHLQ